VREASGTGELETQQWEQNQADEFAGWAMRRLGATLEEARSYALVGSDSHTEALAAVERGWRAAD
jgi:hypothetical protein